MDERAERALRRQTTLEAERSTWDAHWQEVAERVLPRQSEFTTAATVGGDKRSEKIFDSTAPLALERFAAAMESMLTPRTQRWHTLKPPEHLSDDDDARRYCEAVNDVLFRARYAPTANFASQAHETYVGLGAFGSGAMFVDEMLGRGLRYRSIALAELYFQENHQGIVDTIHRRFSLTARQAAQQFGEDALPEAIRKWVQKEPERRFEFLHCVSPREDAQWSRADYRGMPFASYYVSFEGRALVREGGYRTMRYAVSRYVTAPREVYGRSPAMTVLADIKTVNEQQKTLLRTGQLVAEPPILLTRDGSLGAFKLRPGGLNYGTMTPEGRPLAAPFSVGANLPINMEMVEQTRRVINDAFLVTLFQILIEQPQMTATEAMLRAQEKGALLAPTMGRQQSEMLGPLIQAEIDILAQAGQLPPPPDVMYDAGGEVEIEYVSPLSRAQRADEGVGILRTLEQAIAIAEIDPAALDGIDVAATMRELGEINGMPAKLLATPEQIAAKAEARAQQQQMAQMLQAAPLLGKAASDMARAQSMAGGVPSQQAPAVIPANAA